MPEVTTSTVEMMCFQGIADLKQLEGPWLDGMATGDPETTGVAMRLRLAHLTKNSKQLLGGMVLARLDAQTMGNTAGCPQTPNTKKRRPLRSLADDRVVKHTVDAG